MVNVLYIECMNGGEWFPAQSQSGVSLSTSRLREYAQARKLAWIMAADIKDLGK